jgi:hypothetical protein
LVSIWPNTLGDIVQFAYAPEKVWAVCKLNPPALLLVPAKKAFNETLGNKLLEATLIPSLAAFSCSSALIISGRAAITATGKLPGITWLGLMLAKVLSEVNVPGV